MCNSVRQPSKNIQNNMFMRREDIAKIGTVEYVFKSREHADPDRRPIIAGNESMEKKCQNACVNFMALDFLVGCVARLESVSFSKTNADHRLWRSSRKGQLTCRNRIAVAKLTLAEMVEGIAA